jgi:ParB family chromosome partitioning protein
MSNGESATLSPGGLNMFVDVALDDLVIVGENRERLNVEDLVDSMRAMGQITPILITPKDELIAGHRRVQAARTLGWTHLRAQVVDSDNGIELIRACENLVRENLGPVDEILTVTRVVQACGGNVVHAAQCLGQTPRWVRDRGYLARLSSKALKLVAEGKLPLPQARMIACVTDEKIRDRIAEDAAGDGTSNQPPMGVDRLERHIACEMRSLATVPWELDVAWGKFPACNGCPSNTLTDPVLFEGTSIDATKASCTNRRCYESKLAAAEKLRDAAAEKLAKKAAKGPHVELTISAVREVAPAGIKLQSVKRKAQKAIEEKPGASGSSRSMNAAAASDSTLRYQVARAWDELERKQRDAAQRSLLAMLTDESAVTGAALLAAIIDIRPHAERVKRTLEGLKRLRETGALASELLALVRGEKGRLPWSLNLLSGVEITPEMCELLGIDAIPSEKKFVEKRLAELKAKAKEKAAPKAEATKPAKTGKKDRGVTVAQLDAVDRKKRGAKAAKGKVKR